MRPNPEVVPLTLCLGSVPAIIASPRMFQFMERVRRVAASSAAVLITGETGSGKEIVARAIHQYSLRCSRPFVDVNCAALSDHLLESELFGHERGAFSGADSMKQGLFEIADTGTLLLDEIGELDRRMQAKLLRVLDGTPYYRVGGTRKVKCDVRIIASTNVDLAAAVEEGRFRRDLYHRLDQVHLEAPPLRSHPEDIEPLARYFLEKETRILSLSSEALSALSQYSWPGNVRELRNAVTKAALEADGEEIGICDLPQAIQVCVHTRAVTGRTLQEVEQRAILEALSETGGRQQPAAVLLGISRRTLIRKLKLYENQEEEVCPCVAIAG